MADFYSALLGLPTEQDQMEILAQRLRRREGLATLGMLTGDPVLSQWGGAELGRLQEQAEAVQKTRRARPTGTPGWYFAPGSETPTMFPGYREFVAEQRAAKQQLAETKRTAGFEDWYAKKQAELSMPTRSQASAARTTASYLPELRALAAEFASGVEIPEFPEAAAEFARQYIPLGEALAPKLEAYGMTPGAIEWLERGRQTESDIIRLASGLAVTGFELQNVKKWSPWALGISQKQRVDRMRNIYNKLGREAAAVMNQPWEYTEFTPEFLGVQTPEETPTAVETTPAPQYLRGMIPKGTQVIDDPDNPGKKVAVDPTTGQVWELD